MLSKNINPITLFSSIIAIISIAYPNISAHKYSWWFIIPGVFLFIVVCGTHTGTIVYNYLISTNKYTNVVARILILIEIYLVIILVGFIVFHYLYQ